jgi:hypothetical protein
LGVNDRYRAGISIVWLSGKGTLPKLAKVSFAAGEILCLHFPAVGSQLDSLNQPGVHHGKLN